MRLVTSTFKFLTPFIVFFSLSASLPADELNPNFFYLVSGTLVGPRGMQVGDPENWSTPVQNRTGESKSGKITVGPGDFKETGDALTLAWTSRKKLQGSFGIYGAPINLSAYKNAAALVIDMKVDVRPNKDVHIGMDCGYPCRATISARKLLTKAKTGEWFSLPIPLNCLRSDNFDLSKINSPFIVETEGKLQITIANIHLEKLAEGEKGCTDQ